MENTCRIFDMGYKEVINLVDGARLGYVNDVEIDMKTGEVIAVIIPGRLRFFGLLGREDDYIVPWSSIEKIGEDIILIRVDNGTLRRGRSLLKGLK
ncbi:MAG: YlmC/YmxH family sporulation protein [Clostridiaceae bacterium]|nr:YlmC/YmxH family sporulation protein [Clostridiaceae bacterium]